MTDQLPVTLVTKDASQDPLTEDDYRAIITGLREINGWSYQRLADEAGHNGKAWWQMVEKGKRPLDEPGRNALRRLTDGELPEQPPSVTAVTDAYIHPDATMYLVGALPVGERVRRVLMLAANDVTLHVNGTISAEPLQGATSAVDSEMGIDTNTADVTHVTPAAASHSAKRKPVYRPVFSTDEQQRFDELGGIRAVIAAGLAALGVTEKTEDV